jgi:hypothetical protein
MREWYSGGEIGEGARAGQYDGARSVEDGADTECGDSGTAAFLGDSLDKVGLFICFPRSHSVLSFKC